MSNLDFIELAYEHWEALLFCISFSFICYILIFKSWYISILDPFVLSAVLSACGFGVVIFLFLCNAIQLKYFVSYLLTQFAFISGMLLFNRIGFRKLKNKLYILDENKLLRIIYIIVIFSVVIIQFIIYKNIGIPLFMDSRLEASSGGSGAGLLFRFTTVWGTLALLFSFYNIEKKNKQRYIAYCFILFSIITSILNGSKAGFWGLVTTFFLYSVICSDHILCQIRKHEKKILLIGIVAGSFVVFISSNDEINFIQSLIAFGERFIFSGDVYWQTYPNGYIERIDGSRPFETIFVDILGSYRIIPWNELPEPMGISIFRMHVDTDLLTGPNPRHNVMGYVLFGMYGSILFSFLLGAIIGTIHALFYKACDLNLLIKFLIVLSYGYIFGLEGDVSYTISLYNSLFIVMLVLFFLILCYYLILSILRVKRCMCK